MPTSCSVAHAIANAVTDVPDAFDFVPDDLAEGSNVVLFHPYKAAEPTPATLGECVPLLSMALQFMASGPATLTTSGVEQYRTDALRLLEHIRPVIERTAELTLGGWIAKTFAELEISDTVEELSDAFELMGGQLPDPANAGATVTLAECIPLLAIALELIGRGPAAITIECVEDYRASALQLLEYIRTAVENEAKRMLESWTSELLAA
jgi:hypothetical protein